MHVEKDYCSNNYFLKVLIKIVFKEGYNDYVLRIYKINDNFYALKIQILKKEFCIILRKKKGSKKIIDKMFQNSRSKCVK